MIHHHHHLNRRILLIVSRSMSIAFERDNSLVILMKNKCFFFEKVKDTCNQFSCSNFLADISMITYSACKLHD